MNVVSKASFKVKLIVLCIFMCAVSITIGAIGFWGLRSVTDISEQVTDQLMPKFESVNGMFAEYRRARIRLRTLGLPGLSKEQEKQAVSELLESIADFDKHRKEYLSLGFVDGQKEIFDKMDREWNTYKDFIDRIIKLEQKGLNENAKEIVEAFFKEEGALAREYTEKVEALITFHNQTKNKRVEELRKESAKAENLIAIVIALGVLSGLSIGVVFATVVSRAIAKVTESLSAAAENVSSASVQIAESSQELSQATTEQAASLQETAAAVDELSSMVTKNSENARSSASTSQGSQKKAAEGREAVDKMLQSMQEINASNESIMNQINSSNQQMSEIVKVIQEIGNKTKVINDIVFQTKLLSFNASVEAARAGEHGKGFAVVAEEVGNLAQMSGNAAKEISQMLEASIQRVEGIVHETKSRVEGLIADGKGKVQSGVNVARDCSEILNDIVANVESVTAMAREISEASQEQSQGIGEINKAMNQLDQVTQQNAAATTQTAGSAESLATQADSLKHAVSELLTIVFGDEGSNLKGLPPQEGTRRTEEKAKVLAFESMKPKAERKTKSNIKRAVGMDSTPHRDDPGFEES